MNRHFQVIVLDWERAGLADPQADIARLWSQLARLLDIGVWIVIATDAGAEAIERWVTRAVPAARHRLLVSADGGTAVYGFQPTGRIELRWRRVATPAEERLLTTIAEEVVAILHGRYRLDVRVRADASECRRIEILPAQADPSMTACTALAALDERLRRAGFVGGLAAVVSLIQQAAQRVGLTGLRITGDARSVAIGLVDQGDALRRTIEQIVRPMRLPPAAILVVGGAFCTIGGLPDRGAPMIPAVPGAVFIALDDEPTVVPAGVLRLGGGPPRLITLLDEQIQAWERAAKRPTALAPEAAAPLTGADLFAVTADRSWQLIEEGFDVVREHDVEALLALGNGAIGTQGGLAEGSAAGFPVTLVAGLFDALPGTLPELVVAPNWTWRRILIEGNELRVDRDHLLEHQRILDLRRGVLLRHWRQRDPAGRVTTVRCLRFISWPARETLVQILELQPENYTGCLVFETGVDGTVVNADGNDHLDPIDIIEGSPPTLVLRTRGRGDLVACTATTIAQAAAADWMNQPLERRPEWIGQRWSGQVLVGQPYQFATIAALVTSRTSAAPTATAAAACRRTSQMDIRSILEQHASCWQARWRAADVQIEGDDEAQRALRFALYHLIAAANPDDPRTSIGARGYTGEAYKGHIFWDTEIYMLPFYVYTWPDVARTLLTYRFLTLPAARARAEALGYRGALWAWEAIDTGDDATPPFVVTPAGEVLPILTAAHEHHIAADIAYAVWQYWQATGDDLFFAQMGAEMILEAARFWASRAETDAAGMYHIRQVIGPDEYHEVVDDNAYTNGLARWTLQRAEEALAILGAAWPEHARGLIERLGLSTREVEHWREVATRLVDGLNRTTGFIEQFAGYCTLEDLDLRAFEPLTAPIDVLLGRARTARTQIVKQADVVLLLYLLWDQFSPEVHRVNFQYYEPRTAHGSSLSPSIYALVAARLGDLDRAVRYFAQAGAVDLANNMGNTAGGVHLGAMGGLWQATVFGFGGVQPEPKTASLTLDPHLPTSWRALRFPLQFRGRHLSIAVEGSPRVLSIRLDAGEPLTIRTSTGPAVRIEGGRIYRASQIDGRWGPWTTIPFP